MNRRMKLTTQWGKEYLIAAKTATRNFSSTYLHGKDLTNSENIVNEEFTQPSEECQVVVTPTSGTEHGKKEIFLCKEES
ncbi:uncharacterized protein LOC143036960 isoform X2 [Oratosquilla oratoria]|uniref:uncharacterized protein LOC143036960 isoform X2 n=1 Tax=Oratosquilla oratoria TaxID=337810 RepID=UPI003F7728D7